MTESVSRYFDYLAGRFPVMCASDEFHFLPRAQAAGRYYDRLDDLSAAGIDECCSTLREFQRKFELLAVGETDLEKLIDLELLKGNIAGTLIELEKNRSWLHNPLLYLKIAFIGLDHALTKPCSDLEERIERTLARLSEIPRLLHQAADNIDKVPQTLHQAALFMVDDSEKYLSEVFLNTSFPDLDRLMPSLQKVLTALTGFGKFLGAVSPFPDREFVAPAIEDTLQEHFLSDRSLPEVFQIAVEEWHENKEHLKRLQRQIDPRKSWKELYHTYSPSDVDKVDTITLYQREMESLQSFFREHDFGEVDSLSLPEVCETPAYLQSVRSSASFSAAFTKDDREKDFFYITTSLPRQKTKNVSELLKKRLHREYKFLTAHETFPGHHLLDSVRRKLENPVRCQIESPLFYEGWAYYVESLLVEYGYTDSPMDVLVDCKRRLWRAARCQIDVGLALNSITQDKALALLTEVGFSREEANNQIDRFRLNPGYQMCYSLGRYEIMKLRHIHGHRMGRSQFHREILRGGELPFHLIEKRFEAI